MSLGEWLKIGSRRCEEAERIAELSRDSLRRDGRWVFQRVVRRLEIGMGRSPDLGAEWGARRKKKSTELESSVNAQTGKSALRYSVRMALLLFVVLLFLGREAKAQVLNLPERPREAPSGSEFVKQVTSLSLAEREKAILSQILSGNVPNFLRKLVPVRTMAYANGLTNTATFYVTPDYLAIGSDQDYFLAPISPNTAQQIADSLNCSLPTPKMVDVIYTSAELKLVPSPISPSPAMTTVGVSG